MLTLNDKYKLYRLDESNICIMQYTLVKSRKTGKEEVKWVDLGLYFSSTYRALRYIKEHVVDEFIGVNECDVDRLIEAIDDKDIEVTYYDSNISSHAEKARSKKESDQ